MSSALTHFHSHHRSAPRRVFSSWESIPLGKVLLTLATFLLLFPNLSAADSSLAQVEVERSDGSLVEGALVAVSERAVTVGTSGGMVRVAAEELPRIELALAKGTKTPRPAVGRIVLSDGSILPVVSVVGPNDSGELELTLPKEARGAEQSFLVSIDIVRSLRLPRPASRKATSERAEAPRVDPLVTQWNDLRTRRPTGDLLVTLRRGGTTLDYLEGFVEGIDEQAVTFVLEGEPVAAPLTKVYGVVFAWPEDLEAKVRAVGPLVSLDSGLQLTAARLTLSTAGELAVTTPAGLEVTAPLSDLLSIDYTAGRIAYLSDLRPETSRVRPLFGLPSALAAAPMPALRTDSAYWGGALMVGTPSKAFRKGLAMRSGSEVAFNLAGEFRQLRGLVAIDPAVQGPRQLRLVIEGDGQTLLDEPITTSDAPMEVALAIEGVNILRLRADRQESLDATLHFGDARLER